MSGLIALATTVVLLVAALPGSVAAAEHPRACRVTNLDSGRKHVNFQRAVWHAEAGDHLRVVGTCRGTAIVRKPLRISGARTARSGPARLIGKNGRPPLAIHPHVDHLTVGSSVAVVHGLVIGDPTRWLDHAATIEPEFLVWDERPDEFVRHCGPVSLSRRVVSAAPGDALWFSGTCRGPLHIEVDMSVLGMTWGASSAPIGQPEKAVTSASGRPMVKRPGTRPSIIVDPSVDELVLEGFRIHEGLRIGDGVR